MTHPTRRIRGGAARYVRWCISALALMLAIAPEAAKAQNIISVPFTNGFIGTTGSNTQQSNNVSTFSTLGIARIFFIQNSSTNQFQIQGNDISGTVRLVSTNGATLDIPASVVWRSTTGNTTILIGIIPKNASPITWVRSGFSNLTITNGSNSGGSNIGGYIANYAGPYATSGSNVSGNAANGVLNDLNTYLATVVSSRPAGPVTVATQSTSSSTPTITGTATLGAGENLTVVVNGVQYSTSTSPAISVTGNTWSLALTSALATGTYDIAATITNTDGFTLSDGTSNELTISKSVTITGSFTANDKVYTGTVAATGNTSGLTLSGVTGGDNVTIASVTLAFADAAVGSGKTVSITGVTLGGTNGGSYTANLTGAPTATAAITTRALTISGVTAQNKVYDGGTSASLTGTAAYVGLQNGESFSVTGSATGTFASENVGTAISVAVSGYTAPSANYTVTQPTLSANITKKSLTLINGFVAENKNYDGNTSATYSSSTLALSGVESGDDVSIGSFTVAFATAGVGTNKTVSITSMTLAGADAGNYQVNLATAPTSTANIVASGATVTIGGSFTANDKTYNGTRAATGNTSGLTLIGVNGGDQVSIASVSLAFQSAGAASGKTVEITEVVLTGAQAGGYSVDLAGAPTATAEILKKGLTISGVSASNKVYDRSTGASLSGTPEYVGLENGESFTVTGTASASFANANVGNGKSVTVTGYTAPSSNYTVTQPMGLSANITPVTLTIGGSFTASSKAFDGNTSATISDNQLTLVGVISPDVVTLSNVSAAFNTAAAGNGKPVSLASASLSGAAAANYTLSLSGAPTTTANITTGGAVTIAGAFTANDKLYDGTTYASGNTAGLTLVGVSGGDNITIASVTLAFRTPTAGAGKTVVISGVTLGGTNAGVYTVNLAGAPTAVAKILPRPVTIGGTFSVEDKLFDGNTTATMSNDALRVVGALGNDILTLSNITVQFASPEVGAARPVNITGATLAGARASSYVLSLTGAPVSSASILALEPPGPVRSLQGTAGDRQISVNFLPPATPGCRAVSRYLVEYRPESGGSWTQIGINVPVALPVIIAPVTNNVSYTVRVAAVNACGAGAWTEIGSLLPLAPARNGDGTVTKNAPGTTTVSTNGASTPVTVAVVQDTTLTVTSRDFTLALRSVDTTGKPVPADNLTLQLEQGGNAIANGTGFGPGTWVSSYILGDNGTPRFLGKMLVKADGTFESTFPIPSDLAAGPYTLQVIGADAAAQPRVAALGVEVLEPEAVLALTATPDRTELTIGDTVIFTLTVTNSGRGAALDVVIPRAFDEPGFRFVSASPIDGRFDNGTLTWTIPRIAAGGTARLTLRAIVLPPSNSPALVQGGVAP